MATPLKQRIIGILVLLFLALIILPLLFGTHQQAVIENKTSADKKLVNLTPTEKFDSDQKQQAESIDVTDPTEQDPSKSVLPSDAPKAQEMIMPEPKIKPGPTNPKVTEVEEQEEEVDNRVDVKSADLAKIQNKMMQTESKVIASASNKTHEHKKQAKTVKTELAQLEVPEPKTTLKAAKKVAARSWLIQLGSFSDRQNADNLVKQLKQKGFTVYTKIGKNASGDQITRVLVTQDKDHSTAESVITKIEKSLKVHGVIVKSVS